MRKLALLVCLFVAGCGDVQPNTQMKETIPTQNCRVSITRIGVIQDNLAYDNRRGIYIIVDTKTKKEYIGVSGIGISELGSHSEHHGDTHYTVEDER